MILGYQITNKQTVLIYRFRTVQQRGQFLGGSGNNAELVGEYHPVNWDATLKRLHIVDGDWGRLTKLSDLFVY